MRTRSSHHVGQTWFSLFSTAVGTGAVVAGEQGLVEVFLPFGQQTGSAAAALVALRYPGCLSDNECTSKASALLCRYFEAEKVEFDVAVDGSQFTSFERQVYDRVMKIPHGEVRTYSEVAADIASPRAVRGVGGAMARNPVPIIIPCHRVVGKGRKMIGYSAEGGIASKLWLLTMERQGNQEQKGGFYACL